MGVGDESGAFIIGDSCTREMSFFLPGVGAACVFVDWQFEMTERVLENLAVVQVRKVCYFM